MSGLLWYLESILELLWTLVKVIGCIFKGIVSFFYVPYKNISDEIVVLTGAAGDIGSLLARKMAKQGLSIIIVIVKAVDIKVPYENENQFWWNWRIHSKIIFIIFNLSCL